MAESSLRGKAGAGFKAFPDATYSLRCHSVIENKKSSKGNMMHVLQIDIINTALGQAHKIREFIVLREDMGWKLDQLLKAWKVPHNREVINKTFNEETQQHEEECDWTFDPQDFVNRAVNADIISVTEPRRDKPDEMMTFYKIEQYREVIEADPAWPRSPWVSKKSQDNGGSSTVRTNGAVEDSDDDLPF